MLLSNASVIDKQVYCVFVGRDEDCGGYCTVFSKLSDSKALGVQAVKVENLNQNGDYLRCSEL